MKSFKHVLVGMGLLGLFLGGSSAWADDAKAAETAKKAVETAKKATDKAANATTKALGKASQKMEDARKALLSAFVDAPAPNPTKAELGKLVPDFKLPGADGKEHQLRSFKGKYIVLEWLNHGCPFVKKHYKNGDMQALQKKYRDKGVVWLSIISSAPGRQGYADAKQAAEANKQHKGNATSVLLDPKGTVGRLYAARVTPHMYIIGPDQKLLYMGAIDSKPSTDPSDIKGSTNYVDQALTQALSGKAITVNKTRPYGCSVKYGS